MAHIVLLREPKIKLKRPVTFEMRHFFLRNLFVISLILSQIILLSSIESVAQIKLSWDPNTEPNLAGYKVYYGTASRTYGLPIVVGNVTTCTVPGLTRGVTYYFAVTAYNTSHNESGYSNEVYGVLTPSVPETVSAPGVLRGPRGGTTGSSYIYIAGGSSSNLRHSVEYQFDWKGDGSDLSSWNSTTSQSKTWTAPGIYSVRARARCVSDTSVISPWLGSLSVNITQATLSYTVTTNPSGLQITVNGANYVTPQAFTWLPGSNYTLAVSSPQGGSSGKRYIHSSWSDGGAQTHTVAVPSSSATYTANFTTQYSLTTSVTPSGGGTASPSGVNWYNSGQTVSVSATPSAGYSFSNWTGDLTGSTNPASLIMSGPKSVTANFGQNQYTLTVNVNPSVGGSVTKNPNKTTYVYGEQVTLTATANSGYSFSGWSEDVSGMANPTTITVNSSKAVTANFTVAGETVSIPTTPTGSTRGVTGKNYSYATGSSTSNLGHSVEYQFDWKGDGSDLSIWGSASQPKTWNTAGIYRVRARARSASNVSVMSGWSMPLTVTINFF
jgi:hypothetical protein